MLDSPIVQIALDLRAVAQRNNYPRSRKITNTEAAQNNFTRFFGLIARPSTPFLVACLLEAHFVDVRKGALKALSASFLEQLKPFPLSAIADMLGFNDAAEALAFVSACGLEVSESSNGAASSVRLHKKLNFNGLYDQL